MSRRRDHHTRWTSHCPDVEGCARLFHGTIGSGVEPGDTCECCGLTYEGEDALSPPVRDEGSQRPDIEPYGWCEECGAQQQTEEDGLVHRRGCSER